MGIADRDIAVIGAGIGGLAAALALARRGARVRLFEQASAFVPVGAGIQVSPNGVAVLEALGLRDACAAHASLPEAIEFHDCRTNRRVARLPLGTACVARYGRPYWHLLRSDLVAVLLAGARAAGVEIHSNSLVSQLGSERDGVSLTTGASRVWRAEVAVAADGVRSAVRTAHFRGAAPRFTGHVAWRALVDASSSRRLPDAARVFMGPGRHLVVYPVGGGRLVNLVAVEERATWAAEGWSAPDDPARLRAAFAGCAGPARVLIEGVSQTWLWGLFDHPPLPTWVTGRIALLGDACHPMLPFLAQGATMALEDAWVLAAEFDRAPTLDHGLRAYDARRRPRATRVQRAAARNGRIFHLRPGMREAAYLGLGMLSHAAPGQLMARFDWLYGGDVVGKD